MQTGIIIAIELVVFVILMTPLLLGIAWETGYIRKLFSTCETGNSLCVDAGETHIRTYINIPGKILAENGDIVDELYLGQAEKRKTWVQKKFGLYWIGFPFMGRRVHQTTIRTDKINPSTKQDSNRPPAEWIEEGQPRIISQLRHVFPMPVLAVDVKFNDGTEGTILLRCDFQTLNPERMLYSQKGGYQNALVSTIRGATNDYCEDRSFADFRAIAKTRGGAMSIEIINRVQQETQGFIGVTVTGVTVEIYNSASLEEERAQRAETLAELQGRATVATAQAAATALDREAAAQARKIIVLAEAQARADGLTGPASITDVAALLDKYLSAGANPDYAVQSATALGRASRFSRKESPVNTLLEGQTPIAVPPSERKVVLARS